MDKIIEDRGSGCLIVHDNVRAKRLVFRTKVDAIYVNVSPGVTIKEAKETVGELCFGLLGSGRKLVCPLVDLNYRIETEYFELSLVSGKREKFLTYPELGEMRTICSLMAGFTDSNLQDWFHKVTEEALWRNAKIILPPRLYTLSERYGLPYRSVQIDSSRG